MNQGLFASPDQRWWLSQAPGIGKSSCSCVVMANETRFLQLIVQGSLGEKVYTVGSAVFPVMNIGE